MLSVTSYTLVVFFLYRGSGATYTVDDMTLEACTHAAEQAMTVYPSPRTTYCIDQVNGDILPVGGQ